MCGFVPLHYLFYLFFRCIARNLCYLYSLIMNSGIFQKNVMIGDLKGLSDFAQSFVSELVSGSVEGSNIHLSQTAVVVGLSGDLGAGKTTFSQQVAKFLGIEEVVNSPTFVIQKNYKTKNDTFKNFVHIDAYRLEDSSEIEKLRFKELLNTPNTLIFIEWPEKISEVLPKETLLLSFLSIDENTRKISY